MRRPIRAITIVLVAAVSASACSGTAADESVRLTERSVQDVLEPQELDMPDSTEAPDSSTSVSPTTTVTESSSTAPGSTAAEVVSSDPPALREACNRLSDFDGAGGWSIVNDGVMGGRSLGSAEVAASVLRFDGTIVTDGGGFTSVRRPLGGGELAGSDRIEMRIRADERIYGLILDDLHQIGGRNVSYRADIDTSGRADEDGWQTVQVRHDDLTPTIFGRVVDAPPFRADEATEIGIIIADGVDGPFTLEIDWVDACGPAS